MKKVMKVMQKSGVEVIESLRSRLQEAEDTLEAIRLGAVDALVVRESDKQQVFTLKSADHTYRVLIESMSQAAMTIAKDGTILYSNSQFSRMLDTPLEQIIGSNLLEFFKPEDRQLLQNLIWSKGSRDLELSLPGDTFVAVVISVRRLPKVEGNAYMSIVITDISERKKAERAKDEFISLASHQLRTPATGVKQYLGMLLGGFAGDLDERQRMFIKTANDSNERQLSVINSILKTAQIDSGVYKVEKEPQNLLALVSAVMIDFHPVILMRRQKLVCKIDTDLEANVDGVELCVALSNLIENASKYSDNGKTVTISARQTAKQTIIRISDQGVGIDLADQAKVFEKFTRVDNTLSDTVSGSGLGLYWTKRIITMHGGTIGIDSKLGKGTTFVIRIPR